MGAYTDILRTLAATGQRFVVVGGVAAVMHGVERVTYDLDLVIDLEPDACRRVVEALLADGWLARAPVDPRGLADPAVRESWVTDKGMMVFSLWDSRGARPPIDLFARYPLDFEALWRDARLVDLDGITIRIAAPAHLVAMKRNAARPKDHDDVAALLRIDPSSGGQDEPK
jgi:hypothetical protein